MKNLTNLSFLLLLTGFFSLNSCKKDVTKGCTNATAINYNSSAEEDDGSCQFNTGCVKEIVEVGSTISTPTTWDSCHIYHVANFLSVTEMLTIQAGTIVKFDAQKGMNINSGMLMVTGTADAPVIFTSSADDSYGGDNNGDGTATSPAKGDWQHITFGNSSGNSLDYCKILYAGNATARYEQALNMGSGSNNSIKHSVIAHTAGGDDQLFGALNMTWCPISCVSQNNTFYDNGIPVRIGIASDFDDSHIFHNPENAAETNLCNGIFVDCTHVSQASTMTWSETEVAYVFGANSGNSWAMVTGRTLILAQDVVLKFNSNISGSGFSILMPDGDGQLQNHDASGVYFTAYADDDFKGDTNGDGSATAPYAGYWSGLSTVGISWYHWSNIYYNEF